MISLNDFVNMIFTDTENDDKANTTVYVFDSDEDRDEFRYNNASVGYFAISSDKKVMCFLQEKYAMARVENIYAYKKNILM